MSRKWLELMGFVLLALIAGACSETGVGDACVPEQVPAGGFCMRNGTRTRPIWLRTMTHPIALHG